MTEKTLLAVIALCLTVLLTPRPQAQDLPQLGTSPVKDVVAAMTLEEKARLVIGYLPALRKVDRRTMDFSVLDFDYPGLGFAIGKVDRLGIPATIVSDGSYGLKKYIKNPDGKWGTTAFPVPILVSSTWDTELANTVATAYGNEGKEYGVDALLGPAMNIQRDPLLGRNFEYYSEDPLLSGKMAAATVRGIQSNNVGAVIKHFVVNNQETNRIANDTRLTTRALREIYLRGFEIAVEEAQPWMIMTSYNKVNGTYTSERRDLLVDLVRGEWGFDGIFITDFNGDGWSPWQVAAGNDLIMPGTTYHRQNIIDAVNDGSLKQSELDTATANLLRYIVKTNEFKGYDYRRDPDLESHAQTARKAAAEGFVLLKNDNALPVPPQVKSALFGISSYKLNVSGVGSGNVRSDYVVNLSDAMPDLDGQVSGFYTSYINDVIQGAPKSDRKFFGNVPLEFVEQLPGDQLVETAATESDVAIVTIGRNAGEGADRKPEKGDWLLTDTETRLLQKVTDAFHAENKKVVVVLNVDGVVETASWKNMVDGILLAWLPGQEGGKAMADVLTGKVNPSGKLPITFHNSYSDTPTHPNFPHDYVHPHDKKIFDYAATMRDTHENGKTKRREKPVSEWVKNVDYTNYEEDIYVGYRYYDTFDKPVSYPFGFGLSYTTFKYGKPRLTEIDEGYRVDIEVANTGSAAGKEVLQFYASSPATPAGQPAHELVAFAKTRLLEPGEKQSLKLVFTKKDLARYDSARVAWILDAGQYILSSASSSRDIRASTTIVVTKEQVLESTTNSVQPEAALNVIKPCVDPAGQTTVCS